MYMYTCEGVAICVYVHVFDVNIRFLYLSSKEMPCHTCTCMARHVHVENIVYMYTVRFNSREIILCI